MSALHAFVSYLFIGIGPLRLCSRASLGGTVGAILLALTLLILRILGGTTLARSCGGQVTFNILVHCVLCLCLCVSNYRLWILLTISLRLPGVTLLRGVLLLAEWLLLTRALLILGLLLTVLRVTWRHTCTAANVSN